MKKTMTRRTTPAKPRGVLIEEFLDLIESDIVWHEDHLTQNNHIKKCLESYRQIKPKREGKK